MSTRVIKDPKGLIALLAFAAVLSLAVFAAVLIGSYKQIAREARNLHPTVQTEEAPEVIIDRVPGIIKHVNMYRALRDLPPVRLDNQLSNSAQAKSDDLVQHHYFAHFRDGTKPWDYIEDAGYNYASAGENLAKCYSSPQDIVAAWINSPAHEAILLGDYDDAGFGSTVNPDDGCAYVTAHFGSR